MSLLNQLESLQSTLHQKFPNEIESSIIALNELTIDIKSDHLQRVCFDLRDQFNFDTLIDLCGVDYLQYGLSEWDTESTTETGFSRAVGVLHQDDFQESAEKFPTQSTWEKPRFGVVYHLLSVKDNKRLRVRSFLEETHLIIDSVTNVWASANWFEREAFDLFGIRFEGHPDLRRILTDYGFVGYPFRKDFPLIGKVEIRYDATLQKCVYEPVSIQPRVTVPKVIRKDHRYLVSK